MAWDAWRTVRTGVLTTALIGAAAFAIDYYRTGYLAHREEAPVSVRYLHDFYQCSIDRSVETLLLPMSISERIEHFFETQRGYCTEQNRLEDNL